MGIPISEANTTDRPQRYTVTMAFFHPPVKAMNSASSAVSRASFQPPRRYPSNATNATTTTQGVASRKRLTGISMLSRRNVLNASS